MEQKVLLDALVQVKRMGNLLNEVQDLSRQLAEAVDRNDQVSMELLINMRREPIEKLADIERVLREQASSVSDPEEGVRLAVLLNGGEAEAEDERMLADLVGSNRRRLEQIIALDRTLNKKLAREKSVYQ